MENPITQIEAHKKRVDKMNGDEIELPPNGTSLTLLQLVYRNTALPLVTRMRAAMAALPVEHARLAVVAQVTEKDFAVLLDQRIKNLQRIEQNGREPQPEAVSTAVEVRLNRRPLTKPLTNDRRYRHGG